MATRKQEHFRDSDTGRFLTENQSKRRDPITVEKERINHPIKPKK